MVNKNENFACARSMILLFSKYVKDNKSGLFFDGVLALSTSILLMSDNELDVIITNKLLQIRLILWNTKIII